MAKETRITLEDKIAAWRKSRGEQYGEELSADARKLFDRVGVGGLAKLRFTPPGSGRPSNDEVLARSLDAQEWGMVLRREGVREAVFKGKDLQADTLGVVFEILCEPFVWFYDLPPISDARIKNVAKHAHKWCAVYMPYGLPIMDHIAMCGVMIAAVLDAFRRKKQGEAPKYDRSGKTKEPAPKTDAPAEPAKDAT